MLITRSNYEEYFLDFIEGNLKDELKQDFLDFLASNPDLKLELDKMQNITDISIHQADVVFDRKNQLKKDEKNIDNKISTNFNKYAIAHLENDLSPKQKNEFLSFLKRNPEKQNDFDLFQKTKLTADNNIRYKEKKSLQRILIFGLSRKSFYTVISMAASLLLILSLYVFTDNSNGINNSKGFSQQSEMKSSVLKSDNDKTEKVNAKILKLAEIPTSKDKGDKVKSETTETEKLNKKKEIDKIKKEIELKKNEYFQKQIPQIDPKSTKKKNDENNLPSDNAIKKEIKKINSKTANPILKKKSTPVKKYVKPVEIHSQGLLASVSKKKESKYLNLRQLATKFFKTRVLKQKEKDVDCNEIGFWEIADAGVESINKITKSDIDIIRKYDNKGDLIAYAYSSPNLSFQKRVKK